MLSSSIIPPNELYLLKSVGVEGKHVLEFGNKRNKHGVYRDWYMENGAASYTSVDWNGEDGALSLDVRTPLIEQCPIMRTQYDLVTNFGFSEHVEGIQGQKALFKNIHELCAVGGVMIHMAPLVDHWVGHPGMVYSYTERFLWMLGLHNDYYILSAGIDQTQGDGRHMVYAVYRKDAATPDAFDWFDSAYEVVACLSR